MAALLSSYPTRRSGPGRPRLRLVEADPTTERSPRTALSSVALGSRPASARELSVGAASERSYWYGPEELAPRAPLPRTVSPRTAPARTVSPGAFAPRPAGLAPAVSVPTRRPAARPAPSVRPARLGSAVATLGVLVGLWFGAGALHGGASPRPAVLPGATLLHSGGYRYIARPGDTLWSIATRLEPNADPRPLLDELAAQVPDGVLTVGETLHLP
jgi:nucleoid-associated protein YgaU